MTCPSESQWAGGSVGRSLTGAGIGAAPGPTSVGSSELVSAIFAELRRQETLQIVAEVRVEPESLSRW